MKEAAGHGKSMNCLKMVWIIQGGMLFLMAIVTLYIFPNSIDGLAKLMPWLTGITALEGGAAFGGPPLKKKLEARR